MPGPDTQFAPVEVGLEVLTGGALPALAADSRTEDPSVGAGLGRIRIIAVEAAGRDGLQNMHVDEQGHSFLLLVLVGSRADLVQLTAPAQPHLGNAVGELQLIEVIGEMTEVDADATLGVHQAD